MTAILVSSRRPPTSTIATANSQIEDEVTDPTAIHDNNRIRNCYAGTPSTCCRWTG